MLQPTVCYRTYSTNYECVLIVISLAISAGSDLTALVPRFMTIRRGGYVAVIVVRYSSAAFVTPLFFLTSS